MPPIHPRLVPRHHGLNRREMRDRHVPLAVEPLALPVIQEIVRAIEDPPGRIIKVRGQRIGGDEHDPREPPRVNPKKFAPAKKRFSR